MSTFFKKNSVLVETANFSLLSIYYEFCIMWFLYVLSFLGNPGRTVVTEVTTNWDPESTLKN